MHFPSPVMAAVIARARVAVVESREKEWATVVHVSPFCKPPLTKYSGHAGPRPTPSVAQGEEAYSPEESRPVHRLQILERFCSQTVSYLTIFWAWPTLILLIL